MHFVMALHAVRARITPHISKSKHNCNTAARPQLVRNPLRTPGMPALTVAGFRWHIASDDVPLFATFGAVFHLCWTGVILLTSQSILNMPDYCHHAGLQYIITVFGLLLCFAFGFIVEILLIWEGCKGAPFELSKRKFMTLLLLLRLGVLAAETAFTAYGTYVVFGTDIKCKVGEEVIWNPKKEVKVLVCLTWGFQVVFLLNALVWYNAWPEHHATLVWEKRFKWIGKWLLCQTGKGDSFETRQTSLRRIARWVTQLVGHVDLTPSDVALALTLVATLQRNRRREHMISSFRQVSGKARAPIARQAIALASADSAPLPAGYQYSSSPTTSAMCAAPPLDLLDRELSDSQEVVLNVEPQEYLNKTVVSILLASEFRKLQKPAGKHEQQPEQPTAQCVSAFASPSVQHSLEDSEQQNQNDVDSSEWLSQQRSLLKSPSQQATTAPSISDVKLACIPEHSQARPPTDAGPSHSKAVDPERTHSLGPGDPLTKFKRQMSLTTRGCITPSGMEDQLRGRLTPEQAVQRYTGQHWRVPASLLSQMAHYATYAIAVYGLEPHSHKESRFTNTLFAWLRKSKKDLQSRRSGRENKGDLYKQLNYEAVKEQAGMDDSELVYVSFSNQALAHLPYMVALDTASRSVVVAVRGTATMEDVITDSVAAPDLLDRSEWLPESFKQQQAQTGERMYAHGGIVAAAAAILKDMDQHNMLHRLLEEFDPYSLDTPHADDGNEDPNVPSWDRTVDYRSWKLVVTGHSLGAGVAALITLRLKDRFPSVKCWAFCPPGGLMSANLSHAAQGFVNCVVVGKDIVPRLSVVNVGRLIDELVTAMALCKHNKNNMLVCKLSKYWRHHRPDELFHTYSQIPVEALEVLDFYNQGIEARNRMLELILPGKIVFLRPRKTNNVRTSWDAVWAAPEEIAKEGIMISPHLLDDHYTATLEAALRGAQYHGGPFDDSHQLYVPPQSDAGLADASVPLSLLV